MVHQVWLYLGAQGSFGGSGVEGVHLWLIKLCCIVNIYLFDWGVWRCAPLGDVWQNITLPSVQACHEEPHAPTGGREAVTHRGMGGTASAQPIHTHERWAGPSSLGSCSGQEVARAVRCRQG